MKNVVQKFNAFFKKLTSYERRQLYDLLGVVRGPDINDSGGHAKGEITCRVRYILGIAGNTEQVGAGRFQYPSYTITDEGSPFLNKSKLQEKADTISHYKEHVHDALLTLVELGYVIDDTKETS